MANWLIKGFKKLGGIAEKTGEVIVNSQIDDIAVGILVPSFSPQWQAIEKHIHAAQLKYQGQEGAGPLKKTEVMAVSPEALALANDAIAWTGKKMVYDMAAVGDAVDLSVALEKKIKEVLSSAKLVDITETVAP